MKGNGTGNRSKRNSDVESGKLKSSPSSSSSSSSTPKRKGCFSGCWGLTAMILILSILFIFGIIGLLGFTRANSALQKLDTYRYCIVMKGSNLYEPGAGDPDGFGVGYVTIDLSKNRLSYGFRYADIGTPEALHIHGPASATSVTISNVFIPNDGTSLDVVTIDTNEIIGTISVPHTDLKSIVDNPTYYYISLKTDDYTTGSIGDRLGMSCIVS